MNYRIFYKLTWNSIRLFQHKKKGYCEYIFHTFSASPLEYLPVDNFLSSFFHFSWKWVLLMLFLNLPSAFFSRSFIIMLLRWDLITFEANFVNFRGMKSWPVAFLLFLSFKSHLTFEATQRKAKKVRKVLIGERKVTQACNK